MNLPWQLGRSHRDECLEQLPILEAAMTEATNFTLSTRMNNLIKIQPRLRDKVSDPLQTSLNPTAYAAYTSANGSNPSRRFTLTLSKALPLNHKVLGICASIAEIELHATGQLHFRPYSDGTIRFTWRPEQSKHPLGNGIRPWDVVIHDRACEIYLAIVHLIPNNENLLTLTDSLNQSQLDVIL